MMGLRVGCQKSYVNVVQMLTEGVIQIILDHLIKK